MAISQKLNQRVRARPDEDEIEEFSDELASDEASDEGESGPEDEEDTDGDGDEDGEDEDGQSNSDVSSEADANVTPSLQTISFGALAKAQASLGKRKRDPSTSHDAASSSSRKRTAPSPPPSEPQEYTKKPRQTLSHRSSKHAPTIQSSRHAVTRKRTIIEPPAIAKARDPRFDSVVLNHSIPTSNTAALNKAAAHASKNYSFLNEYRSDELAALRKQLAIAQGKVPGKKGKQKNKAKAGDPQEAERLKRVITSMTDRQRTFERKEKEKEVVAEHRRKEREMIREGKKSAPWFMKKGDVRKEADTKRFQEMGGKERARALERRRKKVAGKERREMPWGRRGVDGEGE
ncbi:rRNA biogenesis protein rrp36 [Onygenales sp. PD_40]|nr:rRNA biogenesis protein rrp36 [Onygenales sp. PD_40]KAK2782757.1 rRNA biogenesis protein rrp36 [Emmonsiellopsis sp. PD_33]KAK2796950.1 rRNA biogenesis protein rrp36 [Onygenales sp. PD_10]